MFIASCILLLSLCTMLCAQKPNSRIWEFDKIKQTEQALKQVKKPTKLKHEFALMGETPLQHSLRYEMHFASRISGQISLGIIPSYVSDRLYGGLEKEHKDMEINNTYLKEKLELKSILRAGTNYHFKHFYTGLYVYALRAELTDSPEQLMENMNMDPQQRDNMDEYLNKSELVSDFYYHSKLNTKLKSTQLGLCIGKSFKLFKWNALRFKTELNYSFNIGSKLELSSSGRIADTFMNLFITPSVNEQVGESFKKMKLPSLSLGFSYSF